MANTTETLTLTDFLLARIAEDKAVAQAATPSPWDQTNGATERTAQRVVAWGLTAIAASTLPVDAAHIARHDPARVLAECAAKRRIVEDFEILHRDYRVTHDPTTEARRFQATVALAHLAAIYADYPDYREEWRP